MPAACSYATAQLPFFLHLKEKKDSGSLSAFTKITEHLFALSNLIPNLHVDQAYV